MASVEDIKEDLLLYGEAFTESEGMIETLDVSIPFLQLVLENDDLCEDMLLAILGDGECANNITKALDKYLNKHYIEYNE